MEVVSEMSSKKNDRNICQIIGCKMTKTKNILRNHISSSLKNELDIVHEHLLEIGSNLEEDVYINRENIFVFKTSLQSKIEVKYLGLLLEKIEGIIKWSVDLSDWEKILRVEVNGLDKEYIINLLKEEGIFCKELMD